MKFAENASKPPVGLSASLLESSVFEDLCDYGIGCPSLENRAYDSLLHPSRISSSSSFLPHSSVGRKLALRAQITAASLKEPTTSKMIATVASLNDKIVTKDSAEAWVSWLPGKSPTILQGISSGREGDRFGTDAVFEEQKDYLVTLPKDENPNDNSQVVDVAARNGRIIDIWTEETVASQLTDADSI